MILFADSACVVNPFGSENKLLIISTTQYVFGKCMNVHTIVLTVKIVSNFVKYSISLMKKNVFVKHYAPNYILFLKHALTVILKHQKWLSSKIEKSDEH